jgi:hypothetical protein
MNAKAGRTAATSASGTPDGLALATFSPRFGAPVRDQLVNQALARGHVSEQAAKPRSRLAASLYLKIRELGGLSHGPDGIGPHGASFVGLLRDGLAGQRSAANPI